MTDKLALNFWTWYASLNQEAWHHAQSPEAILAGQAGKYIRVTTGEDSIEFVEGTGAGAPTDAKYIVQEANGSLSAEQSLGALATGMVKNTTTASVGVLSIATEGTDYLSHTKDNRTHMHESFDDLTTGAIHGQGTYVSLGSWVSTLPATSTANVAVKSGADKMLTLTSVAGEAAFDTKCTFSNSWGFSGGGRISFKMRCSDVNKADSGFILKSGVTTKAQIYFRTNGQIAYYNGSSATDLQAAANNTWYSVDLLVSDDGYCIIFIDGVYRNRLITGSAALWDNFYFYAVPNAVTGTTADYDDLIVINNYGL